MRMSHPCYKKGQTDFWLGTRVIAGIQRSLEAGVDLGRLRKHSLDVLALTCGFAGYYGFVQKRLLPDHLLESAEIVWQECCLVS